MIDRTIDYGEMARRWADIVLERWIRKIRQLKIGSSGELLKSLNSHLTLEANGDPKKITFTFLYYGRFVDMGVGRGVKLGDTSGRRKKKPWYSSTFLKEVNVLGRELAKRYGYDAGTIPARVFEMHSEIGNNDDAYYNLKK